MKNLDFISANFSQGKLSLHKLCHILCQLTRKSGIMHNRKQLLKKVKRYLDTVLNPSKTTFIVTREMTMKK